MVRYGEGRHRLWDNRYMMEAGGLDKSTDGRATEDTWGF